MAQGHGTIHDRPVCERNPPNIRQMREMRRKLPGFLLIAILAMAGCSREPLGPGPQEIGELYYQAIKAGEFEHAAELYAPNVPRSMVVDELEATRQRLGDLESYRMTDLVSYTASGGMRYTLRFMTRYSRGHSTEGLMLFQSSADNLVRIEQHTLQ